MSVPFSQKTDCPPINRTRKKWRHTTSGSQITHDYKNVAIFFQSQKSDQIWSVFSGAKPIFKSHKITIKKSCMDMNSP